MKVTCPTCQTYLFTCVGRTKISGVICPNGKCKAKMNFDITLAQEQPITEPTRPSKLSEQTL